MLFAVTATVAQQKTVSGVVTDETNQPMPGVAVTVPGTTMGVITDIDGNYHIKLNEGDELISVYLAQDDDEVIVASSTGKCIRFAVSQVRTMGRDTMGVKSMKLDEGEYIVDMTLISPGADILTISENGYGKRCSETEYRLQGRNGKGVKAGIFNEETGRLVNLKQVTTDDDIMLIADDGVVIRVSADEISKIGRNTKGVRIMKMKGGAKIVCVAITKSDKAEEAMAEDMVEETVEETNTSMPELSEDYEEEAKPEEDSDLV